MFQADTRENVPPDSIQYRLTDNKTNTYIFSYFRCLHRANISLVGPQNLPEKTPMLNLHQQYIHTFFSQTFVHSYCFKQIIMLDLYQHNQLIMITTEQQMTVNLPCVMAMKGKCVETGLTNEGFMCLEGSQQRQLTSLMHTVCGKKVSPKVFLPFS